MRHSVILWTRRLLFVAGAGLALFLFVAVPLGLSFLITNTRISSGADISDPPSLPVEDIEFFSSDGIRLSGWWSGRAPVARGTIVFVHGLNRSRMEMVDRARAEYERGFSTLLFDLRNHGRSQSAYTTLGVEESRDVCAAVRFARERDASAPIVLWGVSLGASSALLGANCAHPAAIVSDSSFLSLEETVKHHFREIFHLPSFPIADLLILVTRARLHFDLRDGDVEAAVRALPEVPILFIAGGRDWRMPPEIAGQLLEASGNAHSKMLIIENATHGQAYAEDPGRYLAAVMDFLDEVLPGGV